MASSIESIHTKLKDKMNTAKKYANILGREKGEMLVKRVEEMDSHYNLSVVELLSCYYGEMYYDERKLTNRYCKIITSENFAKKINDIIDELRKAGMAAGSGSEAVLRELNRAKSMEIVINAKKKSPDICKCGARMVFIEELEEFQCSNNFCNKSKRLGDDSPRCVQYIVQESTGRVKQNGYDTLRRFKFWIDRLQAIEDVSFEDEVLESIQGVIRRENYSKRQITAEVMRSILKDPEVQLTDLNHHVPMLVKIFSGVSPPILNFEETQQCMTKFDKIMRLYDVVNQTGSNKPYYPYFIYQVILQMFGKNHAKSALLDYIHLQSRNTVIKNDKIYQKICAASGEKDNLVYVATDPCGRI